MAIFGGVIPKDRKIYGNWQVQSPDGILMFRCDEKKANWYLNRNLGEVIKTSPLIVKLKFKPRGLGNHNKSFGLSEMGNKCVTCGDEEYLTRQAEQFDLLLFDLKNRGDQSIFCGKEVDLSISKFKVRGNPQAETFQCYF